MRKVLVAVACMLLVLCSCATPAVADAEQTGKLSIRFFNVDGIADWGDSTFIRFPNGQSMMIDYGYEDAGIQIAQALKADGITHVTYAVFSHCHSDHTNGYRSLQAAGITFDKAVTSGYYTSGYAWMSSNFKSFGMEELNLTAGDSFDVGEVHFDVLWPVKDRLDYALAKTVENHSGGDGDDVGSTDHMNSTSLVLKMTYGDFSVIFAGDLYAHAEAEMLEYYKDNLSILDCDLLKCMHHGKTTSSSEEFLQALTPSIGVAMNTVAMNNGLYKRYCEAGTVVYQTSQNGSIYIESDGTGYTFTADKPELNKTYQALVDLYVKKEAK